MMLKISKFLVCLTAGAAFLAAPAMAAYSDKYVRSVVLPKIKGVTKSRVVFLYGAPNTRTDLGGGVELYVYGADPEGAAGDCAFHITYDGENVAEAELKGQNYDRRGAEKLPCTRLVKDMLK